MAKSYTCDGCGCSVQEPEVIGNVLQRDYCEPCAEKAHAFLDAEEVIRDACHAQFVAGRTALVNTYALDNFKLPDVPDAA